MRLPVTVRLTTVEHWCKMGPEQNFTQIACGTYHTLVITASGDLFCWGAGTEGRIGLDTSAFQAFAGFL